MRITEQDDQLILRTSWSSLFGSIALGLFFIAITCGMFWDLARDTTLNCTRLEASEIRCQITQTWLGRIVQQVEVENPQQAIVQTRHSSKGGDSYRVALVTAHDRIPLTDFYSSDAGADTLAARFNQFQRNPAAQSISLEQPPSGFLLIFLLIFDAFGLVVILNVHYDTYTFDRYHDMLICKRLSLRGSRTREESLPGLQTEVRQFRGSKGRRYYRVFLLLSSGENIKIDWNASRESAAREVADRIREFTRPGVHISYVNA